MKTPIAVALIQMGALLVAVPAISDAWHEYLRVKVVLAPGMVNMTNIVDRMGEMSRLGYWLGGIGMIALAVGSFLSTRDSEPEHTKPHV